MSLKGTVFLALVLSLGSNYGQSVSSDSLKSPVHTPPVQGTPGDSLTASDPFKQDTSAQRNTIAPEPEDSAAFVLQPKGMLQIMEKTDSSWNPVYQPLPAYKPPLNAQEIMQDSLEAGLKIPSLPQDSLYTPKVIPHFKRNPSPQPTVIKPEMIPFSLEHLQGMSFQMVDMTLDSVVSYIIHSNPQIVSAHLKWMAESRTATSTYGLYEPVFKFDYDYNNILRDLTPLPETMNKYNAGIEGRIPTGGTYNVGFQLSDRENPRYSFNESEAFSGITLTQPILKGAWYGAPLTEIRLAELDKDIAFHNYRSQLMKFISEVDATYWKLSYAQEKFYFAEAAVDIAKTILKDSKIMAATGKLSRLDLNQAESGLAYREATRSKALQDLMGAMNTLKLMFSGDILDDSSWVRAVTPLKDEEIVSAEAAASDTLFAANLEYQPEYLIKKKELEKQKLNVKYKKNQSLPELNVKGSYGFNGIHKSGEIALIKMRENRNRSWSTGVEFTVPLMTGIEGRNQVVAERYQTRIAEINLKSLRHELQATYRLMSHNLGSDALRMANLAEIVLFRREYLNTELLRYKAGKSTYREIFEAQENLNQALQEELETKINYRITGMQMSYITGTLLRERKLEVLGRDGPELSPTLQNIAKNL